jgi:hypothetical protein
LTLKIYSFIDYPMKTNAGISGVKRKRSELDDVPTGDTGRRHDVADMMNRLIKATEGKSLSQLVAAFPFNPFFRRRLEREQEGLSSGASSCSVDVGPRGGIAFKEQVAEYHGMKHNARCKTCWETTTM